MFYRFYGFLKLFIPVCAGLNLCLQAQAQSLDSLQHVEEVVITGRLVRREVIPVQELSGKALHRLGAHNVADALRYFSGVQIKDYGGVGGLKTVNIRSMGTNHVGVFYDGIELGNAQNGTVDLGRFSLDNMEAITLYNGQKSAVFQPAKDFGSSGSIYLQSRTPRFEEGERDHVKATFRSGSFGVINPALLWEHRITDRVSARLGYALETATMKQSAIKIPQLNTARTDLEYFRNRGTNYITTGLGYRGNVWYIDAAFVYSDLHEDFIPYNTLDSDPATLHTRHYNVIATIGFRF